MENVNECYDFIKEKITYLKETYPSLRQTKDDYAFSALCIKSDYYKNPSFDFNDKTITDMMVDGTNDGGVDAMFTDPNSDSMDLVLVQSKFYQKITYEDIINAITKMVNFYNDMKKGTFSCNDKTNTKFANLYAEVGEESKVIFVLYTSAPKNRISSNRYEEKFKALFKNSENFQLRVLFNDDIRETIKEAESQRPDVEQGKLYIDCTDNYLTYRSEEEAVVVNVSAFCIKELYAKHTITLLAKNLRYHVQGASIDRAIRASIQNKPDNFWFKNNGITIICNSFEISGKEVKLTHFSIVNGGQTTYNLYKSKELDKENDFYLPCKIIKIQGETEDEKGDFILKIAQATNSQKAIKQIDLKANSPEQIRFAREMRNNKIFYQTKRGELIPKEYKEDYLNTDLSETGKLCLAAIFQRPGTSRNKPSTIYNSKYYDVIFNGDQIKIAKLTKQLLYMDYYFRDIFLNQFDKQNETNPNINELLPFAHNARTTCIAFTAFASRYYYKNIDDKKVATLFRNIKSDSSSDTLYDLFGDTKSMNLFFPESIFKDKTKLDGILYQLYDAIIKAGRKCYSTSLRYDSSLSQTNFLKKDENYYYILQDGWDILSEKIATVFDSMNE